MHLASIVRAARLPPSVLRDKLRHRIWSAVEQRTGRSNRSHHATPDFWGDFGSIAKVLKSQSDAVANIKHRADIRLNGELPIFGRTVSFSANAIDWRLDPFSGLGWPDAHHSTIDVLDLDRTSDARVVWELNRFQHLIPAAQAFQASGDVMYAQGCVRQMLSWIEQNPSGIGINWTSSMEVAIRGVVWSWLLAALQPSLTLTSDARTAIDGSLWAHGQHVYRHLEHEPHSGNHYLANALGLIVIGGSFGTEREGQTWLRRGRDILEEELPRQFYADGVNYEGSIGYHGLVVEIALLGLVLTERLGQPLSEAVRERIERALEVTLQVTRSDGSYPAIGDVDDGHILPLGNRAPRSQSHLLALGAVLFDRSDFAQVGQVSHDEALWLLGAEARERLQNSTQQTTSNPGSRLFPQGGLGVLRCGTHHLVLDCGDIGSLGRGGHGHADLLSFECFANEQALVVDSGTYSYSGDPIARERYRGAARHNTLVVDGQEPLEPAGLWAFRQPVRPRVLHWSAGERFDVLGAAYTLPGRDITHERWILFDRQRGAWVVDDQIFGGGSHELELRFHIPTTDVEIDGSRAIAAYESQARLLIQRVHSKWANMTIGPSAFSPLYMVEQPATVVRLVGSTVLPARCLAAVVPYEGQCPDQPSIETWAAELTAHRQELTVSR